MLAANLFALITSLALVAPATAYPQPQLQDRGPKRPTTKFSVVGYSDYECEGTSKYSYEGEGEVGCEKITEKNVKSLEITLGDQYTGSLNVAIHENEECDGVIRRKRLTGSKQSMCLTARYEEDPNQAILSWDADREAYLPPVVGF